MTSAAIGPVEGTPGHCLVFVGGLHRSGTTPLTRLLGAHRQISTFHDTGVKEDEGQHLQNVYPAARVHGGPGRFGFGSAAHLTENSTLATSETATQLYASWSRHWDLARPYLVEKSPPNLLMTRFLQALFPHSRMIVIVRNPVVVSLSTRKWAGPRMPLSRLLEHWLIAHETFLADAAHLRSLHVLKYEHLVSDPDRTLGELAAFLDLDGPIPSAGLESGRSSEYRRQWEELQQSRQLWRRVDLHRMQSRMADRVRRLGYDLDDLDLAEPFPKPDPRASQHA